MCMCVCVFVLVFVLCLCGRLLVLPCLFLGARGVFYENMPSHRVNAQDGAGYRHWLWMLHDRLHFGFLYFFFRLFKPSITCSFGRFATTQRLDFLADFQCFTPKGWQFGRLQGSFVCFPSWLMWLQGPRWHAIMIPKVVGAFLLWDQVFLRKKMQVNGTW